jgi:hypothetical protein
MCKDGRAIASTSAKQSDIRIWHLSSLGGNSDAEDDRYAGYSIATTAQCVALQYLSCGTVVCAERGLDAYAWHGDGHDISHGSVIAHSFPTDYDVLVDGLKGVTYGDFTLWDLEMHGYGTNVALERNTALNISQIPEFLLDGNMV